MLSLGGCAQFDGEAPEVVLDLERFSVVSDEVVLTVRVEDPHPKTVTLWNEAGELMEQDADEGEFEIRWATTAADDGVQLLQVSATDKAGNVGESELVPVVVANSGIEQEVFYDPSARVYIPMNYQQVEYHTRGMVASLRGMTRLVSWLTWDATEDWHLELAMGQGLCPHRGIQYAAADGHDGELFIDLAREDLAAEPLAELPGAAQDSDTFPYNTDAATFGSVFAHVAPLDPADHVGQALPIDIHVVLFTE
jgi:hypothetical protein